MRTTVQLLVVAALLCLGIMNLSIRATWSEMEDGVLWTSSGTELSAKEVASGSPAARAGVRQGDLLLAIDHKPVASPEEVVTALHAASRGSVLTYSILRMQGPPQMIDIGVEQIPSGARGLYFVLAAVGIFSLLVGAAVRLRRPDHQATLHFFWL